MNGIENIYNNQSARFKEFGTQQVKQQNITSGYNKINLTVVEDHLFGSNLTASVGHWDVSKGYKNYDLGERWAEFDGVNDGSADYLQAGSFKYLYNNYTIIAWAKPKRYGDLAIIAGSISHRYGIMARGTPYFYFQSADGTKKIYGGNWNEDDWTFVSVTRDSNLGTMIYVDGELVNESSDLTVNNYALSTFRIGFAGGSTTSYYSYKGGVDNVMVFNSSLNADEIKHIYNT